MNTRHYTRQPSMPEERLAGTPATHNGCSVESSFIEPATSCYSSFVGGNRVPASIDAQPGRWSRPARSETLSCLACRT